MMGLVDNIRQKPATGAFLGGLLIVAAAAVLYYGISRPTQIPSRDYYSDDDGKTWFVDQFAKATPFMHNQSPSYRCLVFRGQNGLFAGLLESSLNPGLKPDPARAIVPDAANHQGGADVYLKKPGDKTWAKSGVGQEAMAIMKMTDQKGQPADRIIP